MHDGTTRTWIGAHPLAVRLAGRPRRSRPGPCSDGADPVTAVRRDGAGRSGLVPGLGVDGFGVPVGGRLRLVPGAGRWRAGAALLAAVCVLPVVGGRPVAPHLSADLAAVLLVALAGLAAAVAAGRIGWAAGAAAGRAGVTADMLRVLHDTVLQTLEAMAVQPSAGAGSGPAGGLRTVAELRAAAGAEADRLRRALAELTGPPGRTAIGAEGLPLTVAPGRRPAGVAGRALARAAGRTETRTEGLALTVAPGERLAGVAERALARAAGRTETRTEGLALTGAPGRTVAGTASRALGRMAGWTETRTEGLALTVAPGERLAGVAERALARAAGWTETRTEGLALTGAPGRTVTGTASRGLWRMVAGAARPAGTGAVERSLAAALGEVADEFGRMGLRTEVVAAGDLPEVSPVRRAAVRDAARAALGNVVKHAGVGRAVLRVDSADGGLLLVVRDHGVGFDPSRTAPGFGLGQSIIARLREVGGRASVTSSPGGGTRVLLWVPR
jgi:hypothetical protein